MNERELFKTISNEAETKVPDLYAKIINCAAAEGLLEENAENAAAYSDGDTVVLGGINKKAVAATSLAAVAGICLAVALPIALSPNGGGIPPIALELGEDYAVGAVSTAKLLENFASVKPESSVRSVAKTVGARSATESEVQLFQKYFYAFDSFFGEDMAIPYKESSAESKYANSIKINGKRANGDPIVYAMYYTEAKDVNSSSADGSSVVYYLDGALNTGYGQMLLYGERVLTDGEESSLNIKAFTAPELKDVTYVSMEAEYSVKDGEKVTDFKYKIVIDGQETGNAVLHKPSSDSKDGAAFSFDVPDSDRDENVSFEVMKPEGETNEFTVNYSATYGDVFDKGSFTVVINKSDYDYVLSGLFVYKDNGDGTCEITGYDKRKTLPEKLIIPTKLDGKKVVKIGPSAFSSCYKINTAVIPEGVEEIGLQAFKSSGIQQVDLPSTLKVIDDGAFDGCAKLTNVNLPKGLERIGMGAFRRCIVLESLDIPSTVNSIGVDICQRAEALTSLTVAPDNAVYDGKGNCIIERSAKTVIAGCNTSVLPTDGSVEIIEQSSFAWCNFRTFVIPEGVKIIKHNAFWNCSELQSLSLPESLETIEFSAFFMCEHLESVNIPANVKDLQNGAFGGCSSLGSLTVAEDNAKYKSLQNCIINTRRKELVVGCVTSEIPSDGSIKYIGSYAFQGMKTLKSISIPDSVTEICEVAFADSGLTSVDIPDSVYYLDKSAFSGCEYLKKVKLSNSLTEIDAAVFYDCFNLEEINIPETVTTIQSNAFGNCRSLTNISLPDNLEYIGAAAFEGAGFINLEIPSSVKEIEVSCFTGCRYLQSVTIHSAVTEIGAQAFYECVLLKQINFDGTLAQWEAISKGDGWNYLVDGCTLVCTDQTVTISWEV